MSNKIERTTWSVIQGRYQPCIPYETILPVRDPGTPYTMTDKNSKSESESNEVNRNLIIFVMDIKSRDVTLHFAMDFTVFLGNLIHCDLEN